MKAIYRIGNNLVVEDARIKLFSGKKTKPIVRFYIYEGCHFISTELREKEIKELKFLLGKCLK